ncbi:MAG TPA: hypothetical protein VEJ63_03660 [Planctomycetota bacterium]|nr:hypothetical protein [Planctomycetota bacterium]
MLRAILAGLLIAVLLTGCGGSSPRAQPTVLPAPAAPAAVAPPAADAADATIVSWLQSGDREYMQVACVLAKKKPSDATRAALIALAKQREREWQLRYMAWEALRENAHPDVSKLWIELLDDPNQQAIQAAARGLAATQSQEDVEPLIAAWKRVKSGGPQRNEAGGAILQALAIRRDERTLPIFIEALQSQDWNLRNPAVQALSQMQLSDAALKELLDVVKKEGHPAPAADMYLYSTAFGVFNRQKYRPALDLYFEFLSKPHPPHLTDTMYAGISAMAGPEHYARVSRMLKEEWPNARQGAYQPVQRCNHLIRALANTLHDNVGDDLLAILKERVSNDTTRTALQFMPTYAKEKHEDDLIDIHAHSSDQQVKDTLGGILNSGKFKVMYIQSDKCFKKLDALPVESEGPKK